MSTIALAVGASGFLSFNNSVVGIPPERVASVTWSLLSSGGGALSLNLPNQIVGNSEGVGQVQASAGLVLPTETKLYKTYVEVTPAPIAGAVLTQNPISVAPTVGIGAPTLPAILNMLVPAYIDLSTAGVLEARGVRFTASHKIWFDGTERVTTFVDAGKLTCVIPPSATAKFVPVYVKAGAELTTTIQFEYRDIS